MARHDLLSVFGLESLKSELLSPGESGRWGSVLDGADPRALAFTKALSDAVFKQFVNDPDFLAADPVLLGSWAREELSPASDLDLLFLGPEEKVQPVVRRFQEMGVKIRSRLPEDYFDLSKGVELWDQLSLLDGKPLTEKAARIFEKEKEKIQGARLAQKKSWLRRLREERGQRHARFNSIQNLLEPNLKMGLGGLRDLQQARIIMNLFPDVTAIEDHAKILFGFYSAFFLNLRALLHFEGQGDLVANHLQPQLAEQLGFADYHAFMSFVQRGLSRVSFYSDWLLEEAGQSHKQKALRENRKFKNTGQLARALLKDPSVLTQYEVRRQLEHLWPKATLSKRAAERGKSLRLFFAPKVTDQHWIALFRSRLMDKLLPELKPLVGYVQHDQYHRFTADAHVLQVVREVLHARKSSRHLGGLSKWARDFSKKDWDLLQWTAIYHDLAKGRPQDHSDLGAKWVKRDLVAFGLGDAFTREVQWLVQNHLAFSTAALRRDPQDPQVLRELEALELSPGRIQRLLIFTAIDILGTNPQSWNDWKAKLLTALGEKLLNPERPVQVRLLNATHEWPVEDQNRFLEIGRELGAARIENDLKKVKHKSFDGAWAFHPHKKRLWVRYHQRQDETGTLSKVLGLLFHSGASVLESTVMTLPGIGVYDWFCLDFTGSSASLEKRLQLLAQTTAAPPPKVKWEFVELQSSTDQTWTLLFRGMDQRGLLWNAAAALFEAGMEIKSARVQTWGEKAEDLFVVKSRPDDPQVWLTQFRESLQDSEVGIQNVQHQAVQPFDFSRLGDLSRFAEVI